MEEIINTQPEAPTTAEVVDIQFRPGQKIYYFDPNGIACKAGDHVIIDTARGPEFGTCVSGNHRIAMRDVVAPLRPVLRKTTAHDEKVIQENRAKEKQAYEVCMKKIDEHGLDMQLVSAEYAFDGSKILFFFTADERVDFRELVKNLASMFHTRIELRQIGVRDKAKMVGGLGICGLPFCCASFLDDFQPVSIKMAKTQNLSLNPTKISGTCGRLMCCLKYEQDAYEDLIRTSPKLDSFVDTPEGRGTVIELDLLRQRVKVRMEESPETVSVFPNAEIAVLRSGKAKKNDPPIPADLAPISGKGKRVREDAPKEPRFLDPIKFKYSTETIVEEPEEEAPIPEEETAEEGQGQSKSRRRRNRKPKTAEGEKKAEQPAEKPEKQEQPKQQPKKQPDNKKKGEKKPNQDTSKKQEKKPEQPKQEKKPEGETPAQAEGEAQKKRRPNHHHRRRKPKTPGSGNAPAGE